MKDCFHHRAVTHTGTLDDEGGISKSGGETKAESCQQPLPAGLHRLWDGVCYCKMSLVTRMKGAVTHTCGWALAGRAGWSEQGLEFGLVAAARW